MGPGTKLKKRLKRGDPGINRLDKLAKQHGIDYSRAKNLQDDQGHRQVAGQQNPDRKDCQEDHASQEDTQLVNGSWQKKNRVFRPFFLGKL